MDRQMILMLGMIISITAVVQFVNGLQLADQSCVDPTGLVGVCKHIKVCPRLLSELIVSGKNDAFVQYIRQSNSRCGNVKPLVCCPHSDKSVPHFEIVEPFDPSIHGRLLSVKEGCGFANQTHVRIIGSVPSSKGAFPWLALIGYTNNLDVISWKCGGTLITTRHVLTAAHCIKPTLSVVRLGEHDISSLTDGVARDMKVIRSIPHQRYNQRDGTNDIALLYLEQDVDISLRIRPICLPVNGPFRSKPLNAYIAGWARFQESGLSKPSNILSEQQITVLENEQCKERYSELGKLVSEHQFGKSVICAGDLNGAHNECDIDSGGPLMQQIHVDDGRGAFYQIGIASYSIGCAKTNTPGVFTRVSHFIDWIEENLSIATPYRTKNRFNNDNYSF